jgi:hypothetical protein
MEVIAKSNVCPRVWAALLLSVDSVIAWHTLITRLATRSVAQFCSPRRVQHLCRSVVAKSRVRVGYWTAFEVENNRRPNS